MKLFTVTIEELVSQDVTLSAESKEDAIKKAIEMYKQDKIILSPGNLEMKRVRLAEDCDEWVEF